MFRRLPRLFSCVVMLAAVLAVPDLSAQSTLTFDFETPGQWDANFRTLTAVGGTATGQTTVSGNGVFRQDSTSGSTAGGYLFDQTPADTTSGTQSTFATTGAITVRFDARTSVTNASFAVIFADPANLDNNVVAIVNPKTGADQVRFFKDCQPATSGVPIGTQVNTTVGAETTPNTGAEPGSAFSTVTVTLTVSGTTPTLVVNWGGSTTTSVFSAGDFNFSANKVLVAFRFNDTATTTTPIDLDNIVITSPSAPDNAPAPPEPNVAPVLPSQSDRSVAPYQTLSVTNVATDANNPAQTLTYELLSAPAGATIDSAGLITWTPIASQGGAAYTIQTRVTDNGSPALSATNSFQVTVSAAPTPGYTRTLDFTATTDLSANFRTLLALGGSGGVAGRVADSTGNGVYRLDSVSTNTESAVTYLYDLTPTNTTLGTQSAFDLSGPLTLALGARTGASGSTVAVTFANPDNLDDNVSAVFTLRTGADQVRFFKNGNLDSSGASLGSQVGPTFNPVTSAEAAAPATLLADATTAAFTPLEFTLTRDGSTPTLTVAADGGVVATYTFFKRTLLWRSAVVILRVSDASKSDTTTDTALELDNLVFRAPSAPAAPSTTNTEPVLPVQPAQTVVVGRSLALTNAAEDFDTPAQTLAYELLNPPAGATITADGVINWTPTANQVSATPYTLTTRVTDSGSPALTATNTVQVTVQAAAPLGTYQRAYDFADPAAFFADFRSITRIGGGTAGPTADRRLMLDARSSGGNNTQVFLFDATPGDTSYATQSTFPVSSPLTVEFLVRARSNDSAVAVVFANPQLYGDQILAVVNIRNDAETIRFYRDGGSTLNTSGSLGTQVGSTVSQTTVAEPGALDFLRVRVTLSVSGTTPTLTVQLGNNPAVTSAFSAGDLTWSQTLLALRIDDPSTTTASSGANPIDLADLVIASNDAPAAPPSAAAPPAPVNGNLLSVNPGFEAVSYSNSNELVAFSFTGWDGYKYQAVNGSVRTVNGTVAAGTTTEGTRAFHIDWGGYLSTAPSARAPISPGQTVEFRYDQRSLVRNFPNEKLGVYRFIEFFDSAGIRIKQVWGTQNDYKVQYAGTNATGVWETIALRAVAPPDAAYVGVRIDAPVGRFVDLNNNFTQDRHVELDNIRLTIVPETVDRLAARRAPRLVEPGKVATLKLNYIALAARTLRAALLDAAGTVRASAALNVPAGRFRATPVTLSIPSSLPDGTYSWRLELLPTAGGRAVATVNVPGVLIDQTVALSTAGNGTDFDSDHPNVQFMGRIENTDPKKQWLHWFGSEVRVRFSGPSLALRGTVTDTGFGGAESVSVFVVVDDDFANPISTTLNSFNFVKTLVSGLSDTVHTVRIFKASETDVSFRVDGFRVAAGRGLLRPEPLPSRRIEIYGDSVTSGGTASPSSSAYAPLLGRELDADVHIVSKGGTGVAASFSGQDILVNYYDNLSYPNVFNASATGSLPWDFSRWTADVVVCCIGHNDQFNNGGATFNSRYAEFKGYIRTAYPNAAFVTANTLISANLGQFQNATDPLTSVDPLHTFAFQPYTWSDSVTGHPPTEGHYAQVYGDERRYSLADVVEDRAGWGLETPLTGYETWVTNQFGDSAKIAGEHAPAYDLRGEGLPNLLRYSLGLTTSSPVPAALTTGGVTADGKLTLGFNRASSDIDYVVEVSTDLQNWTTAVVNPGNAGDLVTWTDTLANAPRRFARLRVAFP